MNEDSYIVRHVPQMTPETDIINHSDRNCKVWQIKIVSTSYIEQKYDNEDLVYEFNPEGQE